MRIPLPDIPIQIASRGSAKPTVITIFPNARADLHIDRRYDAAGWQTFLLDGGKGDMDKRADLVDHCWFGLGCGWGFSLGAAARGLTVCRGSAYLSIRYSLTPRRRGVPISGELRTKYQRRLLCREET
jgi:hypothetical protein